MQNQPSGTAAEPDDQTGKPDQLSIEDSRTGKRYRLPIRDASIRALDLRPIKVDPEEFGMLSFDPGLTNTATCRSTITYIDGDRGILNYRGYPIDQLAEHSSFLEVCWLLIHGELPTQSELDAFRAEILPRMPVPEWQKNLHRALPKHAHPMAMLMSAVALLGAEHPDASQVGDSEVRYQQILNLLAMTPTVAAYGHRHRAGKDFVDPDPNLSYVGNFLRMMLGEAGQSYEPNPVLERAFDVLFILHADHEQNCSTNAVRAVASSEAEPYASAAAGVAALYGPLHGGANQAVLEMLQEIGSLERVPEFVQSCKAGERRLMGFGHRVYKSYDPRATIIKQLAYQVFEVSGRNPLLDIALELERIALEDDYFMQRKLYPNVDFYSGLIYQAMGFDPRMYTVFFAVGRMIGWLSHWHEHMADEDQRITRPRQLFLGSDRRDYVPMDQRG